MSKIKTGYINKKDNLLIRLMEITPLILVVISIMTIFGCCYIASN
jgi:hypothetical protein